MPEAVLREKHIQDGGNSWKYLAENCFCTVFFEMNFTTHQR